MAQRVFHIEKNVCTRSVLILMKYLALIKRLFQAFICFLLQVYPVTGNYSYFMVMAMVVVWCSGFPFAVLFMKFRVKEWSD